jgi:hypothetical protein
LSGGGVVCLTGGGRTTGGGIEDKNNNDTNGVHHRSENEVEDLTFDDPSLRGRADVGNNDDVPSKRWYSDSVPRCL